MKQKLFVKTSGIRPWLAGAARFVKDGVVVKEPPSQSLSLGSDECQAILLSEQLL